MSNSTLVRRKKAFLLSNSVCVLIPKAHCEMSGIEEATVIDVSYDSENDQIIIKKVCEKK